MRVLLKKIIFDGTEISESINDTETEYASVEDLLTMHRTVTNKATYIFEIPSVLINEKNVIIAPGQRKKPASISSDEFCEVAFTYLLLKGKFGYKAARDIQISPAQYLIKG